MMLQDFFQQSCIELATCSYSNFFDWVFYPYQLQFGFSGYIIAWGLVIGVVWIRTKNFLMTTLVGVYVGAFLGAGPAIAEASRQWQIAVSMVGVAIGIGLYMLYKFKLSSPY